jgi:hypothetical protein
MQEDDQASAFALDDAEGILMGVLIMAKPRIRPFDAGRFSISLVLYGTGAVRLLG